MSDLSNIGNRILVIYDGHCGFCNHSVRWLLARDRFDRLRFAPSNSPRVARLLAAYGLAPETVQDGPNSLLVLCNASQSAERLLQRSTGVLAVLTQLPQPWQAFAAVARLIPRSLRDAAYRLIARWRYRIWGRLGTCPIPTAAERERFL